MNEETKSPEVQTPIDPEDNGNPLPIIEIHEILAGESPFKSWGMAKVKVTRDGSSKALVIPIRSVDVDARLMQLGIKPPIPPKAPQKVEAGSELAMQAGMVNGGTILAPDFTNKKYRDDLEKYQTKAMMAVLLYGLAVDIKDKDKKVVWSGDPQARRETNPKLLETQMEAALKVLRDAGITSHHYAELTSQINALTQWEEGELEKN